MPGQDEHEGFLELMRKLCSIHRRQWHPSTRLDSNGNLVACNASNGNGNTLESLLGIRSNGYSRPDFRGWELKARTVPNSDKPGVSIVTLFTPEPTSGVYVSADFQEFMHRYAYQDTKGRKDRLNFGGVYRAGAHPNVRTKLRLVLEGFNPETKKYVPNGAIRLLDTRDNEAMAWTFAKLLDHWKIKHSHAAFVPCELRKSVEREYRFGRRILVGEGAEFGLFLNAINDGHIYYDPGIKLEGISTSSPKSKKRSQFRVSSKHLTDLYVSSRIVDACQEAGG